MNSEEPQKIKIEGESPEPKVTIMPLKKISPFTPATFTIEGRITHIEPIRKVNCKGKWNGII